MFKKSSLVLCLIGVIGCGGEGILFNIDEKTSYVLINAADHDYDYFIADNSASDTFKSKYHEASLSSGEIKKVTFKRLIVQRNAIGVRAPDHEGIKNELDHLPKYKKDYNVVAWKSGGLKLITKKKSNVANEFRVRFFKTSYDMNIEINGSPINLKYKDVSDFYTLESCESSIKTATHTYDICNKDLGSSYLMVLNSNGTQVIVKEN